MPAEARRITDEPVVERIPTVKMWTLMLGVCFVLMTAMIPAVANALTVNVCLGTPTGPNCAGTSHMAGSPVIKDVPPTMTPSVSLAGKTFGPATIPGTTTQFTVTITTCTSAQDTQCTGSSTNPAKVVINDGAASGGLLVDSVDLVNAVITVNVTNVAVNTLLSAAATFTIQYESACGQFGSLTGNSYPIAADIDMKATKNDGLTTLGLTGSPDASKVRLTNRVNICTQTTIVNVTAPTAAPSVLCEATTTNPYSTPTTGRCTKSEIQGQQGTNTLPILCGTSGVAGSCSPAYRQDLTLACKRAGCKFTLPKSTAGTFAPKQAIHEGGIGALLSVVGSGSTGFQWPTTCSPTIQWNPPLPSAKQGQGAQDTPFHWNFILPTCLTPSSLSLISMPSDNTPGDTVAQTNDAGYAGVAIQPLGLVQFGQLTEASAVWEYTLGDCAKSLFWGFTVLHEGFPKEVFFDYGQVFDGALTQTWGVPSVTSTGGYKDCLTSPTGGGDPNAQGQTTTPVVNIFDVNDKKWDASQVDPDLDQVSLSQVRSKIRQDFVTQARVVLLPRSDGEDAILELFKIKVVAGNRLQYTSNFTTAGTPTAVDCVGRGQITLRITKTGPASDPNLGDFVEFVQGSAKGQIQFNQSNCTYDLAASNDLVQTNLGAGTFAAQVFISGFPLQLPIPFSSGAQ